MAINTATIQHRRGRLEDFNPEKLMPGEIAVITDERSVYMGFPGGEAEKIVLEKDFTSESIKEKLGYEPADEERVDQLFRDKADYQYVDKKVSNVKVDLTGYAKEDYVDDEIEELNKKIVQETGKLSQEKADQTAIPTKTSQLTNDSGFLTKKPTYTASEVGADASGTAQTKVSEHNVSEESHTDIRLLISNLTTRLNTIANSEDVDLDQLSELVAYIKANRTLIESVTTNKVNVSDIIDNLTTSVSNKPLSAKQGKLLQDQVTELNTKIEDFEMPDAIMVGGSIPKSQDLNNMYAPGAGAIRKMPASTTYKNSPISGKPALLIILPTSAYYCGQLILTEDGELYYRIMYGSSGSRVWTKWFKQSFTPVS